jgi:hypothetical protein
MGAGGRMALKAYGSGRTGWTPLGGAPPIIASGRSLAVVAQLTTASLAHDKYDARHDITGSTYWLHKLRIDGGI